MSDVLRELLIYGEAAQKQGQGSAKVKIATLLLQFFWG